MGHESTEIQGTALIAGASSGIDAIYAGRLAKRDYNLILVARNRSRVTALSQRLRDETGRSVGTIAVDLIDKTDLGWIEAVLRTVASDCW
jgi:short-subunit dehydrogenase